MRRRKRKRNRPTLLAPSLPTLEGREGGRGLDGEERRRRRRRQRGGMDGGAASARRVHAGLGRERESYGRNVS